jgi:glutaconate CoA-transferase, subunit A
MADKRYKHMIPLEEQRPASMERRSKLISLEEAGKIIASKKTISVCGGHSSNSPLALVRAAIKAGAKDVTLIPGTTSGIAVDMLIAAGCLKKLYLSYIGFEFLGFAPAFKKAAQLKTLEIVEADEPFIQLGLQAAAGGRPFNTVQYVYEATDLPKLNKELRKVVDPFTGKEVYAIPPLRSEVFIMHAQAADQYGNTQCWGGNMQEANMAHAADIVIVQADDIVGTDYIMKDPTKSTVSGPTVHYVVHAPYGAHPTFSPGNYGSDAEHLRVYLDLVSKDKVREYLEKYVLEPADQVEYLERIGGLRKLLALRRMLSL